MARLEAALFDFDNTLVSTGSLKEYREAARFDLISDELIAGTRRYRPVIGLIRHLRDRGVRTAVVTNSPRKYVSRLLTHHQLEDLFDEVVCYDDVGWEGKKPSPAGLDLALKRLKVRDRDRVVYVGDEYVDVVAAYRAGIHPVVATWASRDSVTAPPAALLHSAGLLEMAEDIDEKMLFAERCADRRSTVFNRREARFLNLDENAEVATLRQRMKTFCFGRYFSQTGATTAALHDRHPLSLEIARKGEAGYVPPAWLAEMLLKIARAAGSYVHNDGRSIDLVTIVPRKPGKPERLELILRQMRQLSMGVAGSMEFVEDLLYFDTGSVNSLRGMKAAERRAEQEAHLHVKPVNLVGKSVLVIDDVITTGSTISRAMRLLASRGADDVHGVGIAKTVSIFEDQKKECPQCQRFMTIQKDRATGERYWSCSGYRENQACKYTEPVIPNPCPWCGRQLRLRPNRQKGTFFYGCPGWFEKPQCGYTRSK